MAQLRETCLITFLLILLSQTFFFFSNTDNDCILWSQKQNHLECRTCSEKDGTHLMRTKQFPGDSHIVFSVSGDQ